MQVHRLSRKEILMVQKVFFQFGTLFLLLIFAPGTMACGTLSNLIVAPTPTSTPTPTATITPTITPSPTPTLTPTPLPLVAIPLIIFDPFYNMVTTYKRFSGSTQSEWEIIDSTLEGDISGGEYTFEMNLACIGRGEMTFSLILDQGYRKITLAEVDFSVNNQEFQIYKQTVRGMDPDSYSGNKLWLGANINPSDACGINFADSRVLIPGIRK